MYIGIIIEDYNNSFNIIIFEYFNYKVKDYITTLKNFLIFL